MAGITDLREEEIPAEGKLPEFGELEATFTGEDTDLNLYTKADGSGGFRIHYDAAKKVATIDRTGMDKRFNENVGEILDMPLPNGLQKLQIFIDRCSVEIFANDGEATFTSHIYPTEAEHNYTLSHYNSLKIWKYKASVKDDFVV